MFYYSFNQFALKTLWPALHPEKKKTLKYMDIENCMNSILMNVNADHLLDLYAVVLLS